jgi:hypothetical protein
VILPPFRRLRRRYSIWSKQAQQIARPSNKQHYSSSDIPPSHDVPTAHVHERLYSHDSIRSNDMTDVCNGQYDEVAMDHSWLGSQVEDDYTHHGEEEIKVAQLKREDLNGVSWIREWCCWWRGVILARSRTGDDSGYALIAKLQSRLDRLKVLLLQQF